MTVLERWIGQPWCAWRRVASLAAMAAVATVGLGAQADSRPAPTAAQTIDDLVTRVGTGAWNAFSTEITVRRRFVSPSGETTGPEPTVERLRWTRSETPRGWKTTTTRTETPRPAVRSRSGAVTLDPTPTVARIEHVEDGSPIRVWDSRGVEVHLPSAARKARAGLDATSPLDATAAMGAAGVVGSPRGREWVESFVMPAARRSRRKAALVRHFGRPVTVAQGVGRYTRRDGSTEREWLVDEREGLLLEANVVENGALVEHSTFTYERAASGALVKRGLRLERLVSPDEGTRVVTEIEYSDLRLESAGGAR